MNKYPELYTSTLALDLSTVSTGYCFSSNGTELVSGNIKSLGSTKDKKDRMYRIHSIYTQISSIIDENSFTTCIIESPILGRSGVGSITLAYLHGAVNLLLYQHNIEVINVHPSTNKKRLTGSGKASKQQMIEQASFYIPHPVTSDDQADAIGLFVCYTGWAIDPGLVLYSHK